MSLSSARQLAGNSGRFGPQSRLSTHDNETHTRASAAGAGRKAEPCSGHFSRSIGHHGMETIDIVKGIVREVKPDLVITVDALAAGPPRLLTTIQIADTGIQPGSGVETSALGSTNKPWASP